MDNTSFYRDDGLAVIRNANGPNIGRLRKNIIATLENEEFSIAIETNLVETEFSDVTFKWSTGKYYLYNEPNNTLLYIHAKSTYPPSIVKQLRKMILMVYKRILYLSCDESASNNAKLIYELGLKHNGYKNEMRFDRQPSTKRNREIKINWFNPPFSQNMKPNIGKLFSN